MSTVGILKLSGKAIEDFTSNPAWIDAVAILKNQYEGFIIVHGAGNQISEWSSALGLTSQFYNGQRVTDEKVMNVVAAVQAGMINGKLVSYLCSSGFNAAGLTGIDNNLFIADYAEKELGFVGLPKAQPNIKWLHQLFSSDVIPVFSSLCRDAEGNLMNVNADVFTNALASALKAETVFFISDVDGVKLEGETQSHIKEQQIRKGIEEKQITGGMIPKLESCVSLLQSGVAKVWIGNNIFPMLAADASPYGGGTWIIKNSELRIKS